MNILEQIFKIENPKLEHKISADVYDLLLDWFNESKISPTRFEADFFEPIIKAVRTLEHENKYFENNFEVMRREYYLKFAFLYLIYHYTRNEFLNRFFKLENNYKLSSSIPHWHSHASLANNNPELFLPLTIGGQIAKFYHAIHARLDQNISSLPSNFAQLKFEKSNVHFHKVFEYVNQQSFKEKPYLFFLLFCSVDKKNSYEQDENGKYVNKQIETISTSPYDSIIEAAFENSIEEYNQQNKTNLSKDLFLILNDFLSYRNFIKKTKISIDTFEQAQTLIRKTKGRELLILEHIIYFLQYEYLHEQNKYWEVLLTEICEKLTCTVSWLEQQIDFLSTKKEDRTSMSRDEIRNFHLITQYIIPPLLNNLAQQLNYTDTIVQKYESLIFKRTQTVPDQKGVDVLRKIARNSIESIEKKTLLLSKCSPFYFESNNLSNTYLKHDEKDKTYSIIKNFIHYLNIIVPIALKKVCKQTFRDEVQDEHFLIINHANEDIVISRSNFISDINALLERVNSPYKLIAIPLILKKPDWHNNQFILFSLAFMNESEYMYFDQNYLIDDNIKKWSRNTNNYEWFKNQIKTSSNLHPTFSCQTTISFEELKNASINRTDFPKNSIFLSDVNWEWFKIKYVDALSSKEHWYKIMHVICQCPKGKKPNTAWINELRKEIETLGAEKYFKELQVLISSSITEASWYFDVYANALKGLIWSCAYIEPNDLSLSILKTITEFSYTKVYGVGATSTSTGNLALEALVATQKEEAFGILNIMRNKTKYNKFILALEKNIDKFKATSTVPEQLLADKSIPTFGFKGGKREFEIVDFKITLSFQKKKLVKQFTDKDGIIVKKIPDQITADHAKTLKEINEEIKQINSIFNDLSKRIKTYWLYDRVWTFADWNIYINKHELIYPHIENLIWTNKTQQKDYIIIDKQLLDSNNEPVAPNQTDEICLWHPVLNNENTIRIWQDYIWKNNIVQSIRQAFRESYPFSTSELELLETPRFAHHFLEVQKLMAIANNTGWIFTYTHEGVNWPRIYIKPLHITAHLICDYDRYSHAIPTKNVYFTNGNSTKINEYNQKMSYDKLKFSEIPIVTLSEICRDMDLFIATTSIANNVELSANKQEYETYRIEYQKGLFSDNANARIRKQIIIKLAPILTFTIDSFEGNYVVIKGKSDRYKINLNSGFAQSNDTLKHINLIPDIKKIKTDKKLRLPIEDDETLYIILAKIIYLQSI